MAMSGTPVPTLSQDAKQLNLEWRANDPVDLSFIIRATDLSGPYTAEIRDKPNRRGNLLATLTVAATLVGSDTLFRLTLADSSPIRQNAFYDLQQVGGRTLLAGMVIVIEDVTV